MFFSSPIAVHGKGRQGRPQDFGLGGGANLLREAQNKDSRKARKIL